jgi:hypothetical protein
MGQSEPPSTLRPRNAPLFFIGCNGRGNWVVRDQSGRRGGLFIGRTEALRFALFENGHRPQAVVMVPGALELDLGPTACVGVRVSGPSRPYHPATP